MFLLLLLLVVVEERLCALRGEVLGQPGRECPALLAPFVHDLDVQRPLLLTRLLVDPGRQPHPRHTFLLVLLFDDFLQAVIVN
ncbi:hypothetical protein AQ436_10565 [Arthrobacter sp. EpRS66]|nr:hypothetical protein AQ436_10565 [Arthrobacter sp. EpRS66]